MSGELGVLFVEDDAAVRRGGEQALSLAGLSVTPCADAESAFAQLHGDFPGIVITDVKLPGKDGLALLAFAVAQDPELPVILVTGHGDVSMAVQAMRSGAYDFIEKTFPSEHLVEVVLRAAEKRRLKLEVEQLRNKLRNRVGIEAAMLGKSPYIEQVRRTILDLADTMANV